MGLATDRRTTSQVIVSPFAGRAPAALAPGGPSDPEAQSALRQFTLERLTSYGVDYADAVELRGRVTAGEAWLTVAAELATTCLAPPEASAAPMSPATQANRLYRASALARMSQMMMLADNDQRREIFQRSADLFRRGAALSGDRQPLVVETEQGPLAGWMYPSQGGKSVGCAVVIGGLEGWAMDFGALGLALARRQVDALVLDGPGQGESRLTHRHYLTQSWMRSYQDVFRYLAAQTGGAPLALVGNSMGGAIALRLASLDARIVACCDNGGPGRQGRGPADPSALAKILAFCGGVPAAAAIEVWRTINPPAPEESITCPLLVVHGGLDHLVSTEDARGIFDAAKSSDKQMVIYSDGDHCVYNHADDKHNLISDWVSSRLIARPI